MSPEKHTDRPSHGHESDAQGAPPVDRLSALFERFRVRASLFHSGALCGLTHFDARPGRAFLHVLQAGDMGVTHRPRSGAPRRLHLTEPTLLLYPRPLEHRFEHRLREGSDLVCATLDFDGGAAHPLARSLPPLVVLPLSAAPGLAPTLEALFAETERLRCGQRLLADRLFEVLLLQVLRWMLDHPDASDVPAGLLSGLAEPRLARALTAVHERPGAPWTLEAMAAAAAMSRSAFAAAFKARLGVAPAAYLLGWRVALAQTRLRAGESVKTVADALGYTSATAFSRAFAQHCGVSPRAWLQADRAAAASTAQTAP
jgi:AraC-like DNA-binding protein